MNRITKLWCKLLKYTKKAHYRVIDELAKFPISVLEKNGYKSVNEFVHRLEKDSGFSVGTGFSAAYLRALWEIAQSGLKGQDYHAMGPRKARLIVLAQNRRKEPVPKELLEMAKSAKSSKLKHALEQWAPLKYPWGWG